jgi:hypothetical protein
MYWDETSLLGAAAFEVEGLASSGSVAVVATTVLG